MMADKNDHDLSKDFVYEVNNIAQGLSVNVNSDKCPKSKIYKSIRITHLPKNLVIVPSPTTDDRGHFVIWPTDIYNLSPNITIKNLDKPKIAKKDYIARLHEMTYKWQIDR
jgi:hypothetical protein